MTREEAIKELEQLKQTFYDLEIGNTVTSALCMAIEALQERTKGRWIEHLHIGDDGSPRGSHYECSNCRYDDVYDIEDMNYCPNCGSDNRGEEE